MRKLLTTMIIMAALTAPAMAQNVAANNGIWWTQPAAGGPWQFLNPLTTLYGRLGFLYAFNGTPRDAQPSLPRQYPVHDQAGGVLGIGFRVMPILRLELQAGGLFTTQLDVVQGGVNQGALTRIRTFQVLGNAHVDLAPFFANGLAGFNPYVMGGLGVSVNGSNAARIGLPHTLDHQVTTFAWNAGFGLQYQIVNHLILDLGYRYLNSGRLQDSTGGRTTALTAHQIMFSLVVPFEGLTRAFGN